MNELTDKLIVASKQHKGTDLGGLLQWAVLHIQAQNDALIEIRDEIASEKIERNRMEQAIYITKNSMQQLIDALDYSRPVNIEFAKDYAPHVNIMARYGVEPYVKKSRKKKENS